MMHVTRAEPTVPVFMQLAAAVPIAKAIALQHLRQFSSSYSCSWHKPDLTKLDQAGKTVRGKQLWGKSYGERFGEE